MQEAGPALTNWSAILCMQSGESRQNLSKETHRPQVKHLEHFVRLSREARSDIEWWFQFSSDWNGATMIQRGQKTGATVTLTSDASGVGYIGTHYGLYRAYYRMPHHSKGAGTYCGSGSIVGQGMVGPDSPRLVR